MRVLCDYDETFSWHVCNLYQKELRKEQSTLSIKLKKLYEKIDLLVLENSKLKNKPIHVELVGGENLLYAYVCNNHVKFGTSFCNKNGQRPKSHKTSVPDLAIGFVIYASKKNLIKLNKKIKERYRITGEHIYNNNINKVEKFVIEYFELMRYNYKKESIQQLKLLNIFLKS